MRIYHESACEFLKGKCQRQVADSKEWHISDVRSGRECTGIRGDAPCRLRPCKGRYGL